MTIHHDSAAHTFSSGEAELAYTTPAPGVIDFTHTFVPEDERGQGEGEELARTGLDYARQHQLKVRTTCPFVAAYVQQHPNYDDILDK